MEKVDLYKLDGRVLAFNFETNDLEKIVTLTCDLASEEKEHNLNHALRTCIGIESQLRLREIAQQPSLSQVMQGALAAKGLCSMEVILRKLEELIPYKDLHALILIRAQASLNMSLKQHHENVINLKPTTELKMELDKLPNLRTSLVEGIFGDWWTNKDKQKVDDLIYIALQLASGSQSTTETAIIGLLLHHICSTQQEKPLNENERKILQLFKTADKRTQIYIELALGKENAEVVASYT